MKLAAFAIVTTLGFGGIAFADPAAAPAPAPAARPSGELRQLLLERFDRNHDGVLDAKERHRAIHALRRLARRLAMQERRREHGEYRDEPRDRDEERRARRLERVHALVQRYDRNHDGVVSPDEMPPDLARRLQWLDRNHDGWLDERDAP
jgi:hypothetical protein